MDQTQVDTVNTGNEFSAWYRYSRPFILFAWRNRLHTNIKSINGVAYAPVKRGSYRPNYVTLARALK